MYHFGFDESAGNFQENNFERGGLDGDPVLVEVQDYVCFHAVLFSIFQSGMNNANFYTPRDGTSPVMQLYLTNYDANWVVIHDPATASIKVGVGSSTFGPPAFHVSAEVAPAWPATACSELNAFPAGYIALIDRGGCTFTQKVKNAQDAGAIGAIICNNVPGVAVTAGMGGEDSSINIPSILLSHNDCQVLKDRLPTTSVHVDLQRVRAVRDTGQHPLFGF